METGYTMGPLKTCFITAVEEKRVELNTVTIPREQSVQGLITTKSGVEFENRILSKT